MGTCPGGICHGGYSSGGYLSGDFVQGCFVRGVYVLEPVKSSNFYAFGVLTSSYVAQSSLVYKAK